VFIDGGSSKVNKLIKEELMAMNSDVSKDILSKITDE
jgi:hypothetical protein